jgi:hypothetical protein
MELAIIFQAFLVPLKFQQIFSALIGQNEYHRPSYRKLPVGAATAINTLQQNALAAASVFAIRLGYILIRSPKKVLSIKNQKRFKMKGFRVGKGIKNLKLPLEKIDAIFFTPWRWRGGTYADFNIVATTKHIVEAKEKLKYYTVGYCDAESLLCRSKDRHKAVMFFKNDRYFWCHMRNEEFEKVYA